ncbi:MAG: CRISPR system precrRNA processing endoribonuclease RAMP protein Cas6 [Fibrobacter sp.]|nr:CRISPR system precrRNA processing endoribonuclease RAMP protein Cas6 [Fibrobacter sp.]
MPEDRSFPEFRCLIPYNRFTINLSLNDSKPISRFVEATIRGGFGITLRKLVCPSVEKNCAECILRHSCIYCYLFETTPQSNSPRLKNYKALPRPFTLWCEQNENTINIELVLIGNAIKTLPYFIYTLRKLGSQGLGKERIRYELKTVRAGEKVVYDNSSDEIDMQFAKDKLDIKQGKAQTGRCVLNFYSPMILRKNGRIVDGYDSHAFFSTLMRRITSLFVIHCDGENFDDLKPLLKLWEEKIKAQTSLKRVHKSRFSTRQNRRIKYDGFTGEVILEGDLGTFMPFLNAGEILSVGKNTAFGYGKYKIKEIEMR